MAKIYTATYVVQPGDTLLKVSMMFKVRSAELANVNNIFGETIWANQVSRYSVCQIAQLLGSSQDQLSRAAQKDF